MNYSAGIIPYKVIEGKKYYFLGHPGGPSWKNKSYYTMCKGHVENGESILEAALREFKEESNVDLSDLKDKLSYLGSVKQNKEKTVHAYAIDVTNYLDRFFHLKSNMADGCNWPEMDSYIWLQFSEVKINTYYRHITFYEQIESI